MRLIGATEPAIRGPFLLAAAAPGILAGVVAVVGTIAVAERVSRLVAALGLPPIGLSPAMLVAQGAVACLLPLVAAAIILVRHAGGDFEGTRA
jgi:cell division protein FtsX